MKNNSLIYSAFAFCSSNASKNTRLIKFLLAFSVVIVGACDDKDDSPNPAPIPYVYETPAQTADGWSVAHVQDVGMDDSLLIELMDNIRQGDEGFRLIDSIVIAKDGLLIFDELIRTELDEFDDDIGNNDIETHTLRSASKSFGSTLVGIAIYQSYISNVDVPVHDFFQHKQPIANWNETKQSMTLEDWLTMRAGYTWREDSFSGNDSWGEFWQNDDPIQYLLDLPVVDTPGETFTYNTGVSYALGRIVQLATGQDLNQFMEDNLFLPLNIQHYQYKALDGQLDPGASLYLRIRDMAKLGQLFLDGGVWSGQRIVAEDWVNMATQSQHEFNTGSDGYGYQWWTHDFEYDGDVVPGYRATGYGGQHIFVIPDLNLVVAVTGHAYNEGRVEERRQLRIIQDYILPSIL